MMGSVMGIFTLMTPVLIHLVVRNYVTQLSYDPTTDRYTASTITLMLRTRQVRPSAADRHVPSQWRLVVQLYWCHRPVPCGTDVAGATLTPLSGSGGSGDMQKLMAVHGRMETRGGKS